MTCLNGLNTPYIIQRSRREKSSLALCCLLARIRNITVNVSVFFFLSCFQFLQSLRLKLWMLWWRFFSRDLDLREYLQARVRIYVFVHNPERHRTVKLILFSSVLICLCRSSEPGQPVHELQVFELIRVFYSLQQNFCLRVTEQRTLFVYGAVRVRWRQMKHLFLLQSDTSRLEWLHFFKSLLYSRCLSIGKTKSWFCIIGGEKLFLSVCCRPKKEWWCEDLCVWFVN